LPFKRNLQRYGAVGSKVISGRKKKHEVEPSDESSSSSFASSSVSAMDGAVGNSGDDDDIAACLIGASCSPDFSSIDEEGDDNAAATIVQQSFSAAAAADANASPSWWKGQAFDDVYKTVVFSACYGGFFQPHWFNVLNSYDWSDIILPAELEMQLQAIGENLHRGQTAPGAPAEGPFLADFLQFAGGYSDPSLVASVSLSLAAPLEAAGSFLVGLYKLNAVGP
jgi:hypothetical protein